MEGFILAAIGAGLAVGLPGLGSAIGSGLAGASASGVIAEKKEEFVTGLIFEALPQTAVIFGFVIAIMIVGAIEEGMSTLDGAKMLGAGIAMGIAGLTPIGQGPAAAAGIGSTARSPATKVNNIVYTAIPDLSVIMGFVIAFMLISA
ncbi:archaeal A1AO-type ATP synthase, subunit K (fragment) [groundwater metagenome]|uniref:Archaeal A1AO-type ATP synthase, subunit K n=1 Tax=groundwater metagenome TaxID=717931 RepID=A0A098E5Y6_9ZZZZ